MHRYFSTICFLLLVLPVFAQPADSVFHEADCQSRPVLLIFSGSDWCAPCIRFEKQIASTETFKAFASEHLVVLEADFPQRKKLPEAVVRRNEQLAQLYNQDGSFPKILLLRPDRSIIARLDFNDQSPEAFIRQITAHLHDEAKGNQKAG